MVFVPSAGMGDVELSVWLQGSLPLMLTFDLREEAEPDPVTVAKIVDKYDVIVSIKPKPKLSVKSVNIRGYERNAGNIYEARRMILGTADADEKVPAAIPPAYLIASADPSFSFRESSVTFTSFSLISIDFVLVEGSLLGKPILEVLLWSL